jgi:hypothetical protein
MPVYMFSRGVLSRPGAKAALIALGFLFSIGSLGLGVRCIWPKRTPAPVSATQEQAPRLIGGEGFNQPVGR